MRIELPIRIESTANKREHWAAKARRMKAHRQAAMAIPRHELPDPPCVVTITRIAPRKLDSDNLANGCKGLRDGIADRFGIDDGDERIQWRYAQEKGQPKEYAVRVEITPINEI